MDEKYSNVIYNMSNPNYLLGRIRRIESLIGKTFATALNEQSRQQLLHELKGASYEQNPNPETDTVNKEALEDVRRGYLDSGRCVADTIERYVKKS